MSEFRRKLLSKHKTYGWVEIAKITTIGTTEVSLPKYREIGFFVVGGGGSGHSDFSTTRWTGSGGNGGCVNHFTVPFTTTSCTVVVGSGGAKTGVKGSKSNNGSPSSIVYNGITYKSDGGFGGSNSKGELNTKQVNSGLGGFGKWGGYNDEAMYVWCANHPASELYPGTIIPGGKGENGLPNQFDETDTNLYGAGGGASQNAYYPTTLYVGPAIPGGVKGGGDGGYGNNNANTNMGQDGSFYGAGGGGGSFSSKHTYSRGGAGYQGIVIIYGKK